MRDPIPILEVSTYGVAIFLTWSVSAFSIASWLNTRWFAGRGASFYTVYIGVLVAVVGWGLLLFEPSQWLGWPFRPGLVAASAPVAVALGVLASRLDRNIVRRFARHRLATSDSYSVSDVTGRMRVRSTAGGLAHNKVRTSVGRRSFHLDSANVEFGFWSLGAGAILEELIFRSALVQLCSLLGPPVLVWGGLALTLVVFALSHIQFGWAHVMGKAPLGAIALACVLVLGTVIPALIVHVTFNFLVWRDFRQARGA